MACRSGLPESWLGHAVRSTRGNCPATRPTAERCRAMRSSPINRSVQVARERRSSYSTAPEPCTASDTSPLPPHDRIEPNRGRTRILVASEGGTRTFGFSPARRPHTVANRRAGPMASPTHRRRPRMWLWRSPMALMAVAIPILPGKTPEWRKFIDELERPAAPGVRRLPTTGRRPRANVPAADTDGRPRHRDARRRRSRAFVRAADDGDRRVQQMVRRARHGGPRRPTNADDRIAVRTCRGLRPGLTSRGTDRQLQHARPTAASRRT